jgi:hypothetical protein
MADNLIETAETRWYLSPTTRTMSPHEIEFWRRAFGQESQETAPIAAAEESAGATPGGTVDPTHPDNVAHIIRQAEHHLNEAHCTRKQAESIRKAADRCINAHDLARGIGRL